MSIQDHMNKSLFVFTDQELEEFVQEIKTEQTKRIKEKENKSVKAWDTITQNWFGR